MTDLTQDRLKELLDYSPFLGLFWHLPRPVRPEHERTDKVWNTRFANKVAGFKSNDYLRIKVGRREYMAHRLAWLYMTGEWPTEQIDHINGTKDDNRFSNLREATNQENHRNRTRLPSNNTSGHVGVYWKRKRQKWCAQIKINGEVKVLGSSFDSKQDAIAARREAEKKYFGEFAPDIQ